VFGLGVIPFVAVVVGIIAISLVGAVAILFDRDRVSRLVVALVFNIVVIVMVGEVAILVDILVAILVAVLVSVVAILVVCAVAILLAGRMVFYLATNGLCRIPLLGGEGIKYPGSLLYLFSSGFRLKRKSRIFTFPALLTITVSAKRVDPCCVTTTQGFRSRSA